MILSFLLLLRRVCLVHLPFIDFFVFCFMFKFFIYSGYKSSVRRVTGKSVPHSVGSVLMFLILSFAVQKLLFLIFSWYWGLNSVTFYHWPTYQELFIFILRHGLTKLLRLPSNLWSSASQTTMTIDVGHNIRQMIFNLMASLLLIQGCLLS